jgi:DMSO/TMAO reductase YedYZ molybdopterin-dependent catalytic subunit
MYMAEERPDTDNQEERAASETSPRVPKGMGKGKLLALIVIAALLIGVPLGYLAIQGMESDEPSESGVAVTLIGKSGDEVNVTLEEIEDMVYLEAVSSYQNRFGNWRGYGAYRGVDLGTLADLAGGMEPGDIMTVTAYDGYCQNLSYYQVHPEGDCLEVQGPSVLAYQFNGTMCPDWEDGPMVAMLAPDQAFSNIDFNNTCAKDPEFLGSTSAGSLWVKNVERIQIRAMYEEWTVGVTNLEGVQTDITRTKFVSLQHFEGESFVDPVQRNWSGVPVEVILGLVDDDDPTTYNATLGASEYRMIVTATDDYARTLIAQELVDIGAIFAIEMNGTTLPEDFAPIRLVGPDMSNKNMVSMIGSVVMDRVAVTVTAEEEARALTITELAKMDLYSGSGYFMRSTGAIVGPLNLTGVPIRDLVDLVMEGDNYSLNTVAWDGYEMTYSSGQIESGTFPVYDLDGVLLGPENLTMMLAIEDNGVRLPYDELRIVIVDNESQPVTDGHYWTKMAKELNVVPYIADWTLELNGVSSMGMDRQTFESLASCYYHTTTYELIDDDGDHVYEGVPLWVLVSAVDGGDAPDGHYLFNDALVEGGYTVNVTASDGYSGYFDAAQVARNDSIIVAYKLDGEPLDESSWPLRIVGDDLPGSQKVKMIARIAIEGFVETPAWELSLFGLTDAVMTEWNMVALFNCDEGLHVSYYNYTEDLVEHSYAGIPLWVLVGMVDGSDDGHWLFNDTLAELGYSVNVSASDHYVEIQIADIAYNDDLIVALKFDGEYLTGDAYPLRLVGEIDGEEIPSLMRVKAVVAIELVDLPE